MRILAVDDEEMALKNLCMKLEKCTPDSEVSTFSSCVEALKWLKGHKVDAAILDINMSEMDGLALAARVREVQPDCSIIFLTGYSEYAVRAFAMKASGYLLKPVGVEELKRELDYVIDSKKQKYVSDQGKLAVQCFGNFEVFHQGSPVAFSRQKSKELLAYLIDRRGAYVTMSQIASILWEDGKYDRSRNNQIHSFLHDLQKTLQSIGKEDVILKRRNMLAVDTGKIDCDYFAYFQGDTAAVNSYTGEYMVQYWWSEFMSGWMTSH